jgi:hypothetical protein
MSRVLKGSVLTIDTQRTLQGISSCQTILKKRAKFVPEADAPVEFSWQLDSQTAATTFANFSYPQRNSRSVVSQLMQESVNETP